MKIFVVDPCDDGLRRQPPQWLATQAPRASQSPSEHSSSCAPARLVSDAAAAVDDDDDLVGTANDVEPTLTPRATGTDARTHNRPNRRSRPRGTPSCRLLFSRDRPAVPSPWTLTLFRPVVDPPPSTHRVGVGPAGDAEAGESALCARPSAI
ncbi:hypothetical protein PHLGIDRAFT_123080 [Phlebiopsis gigantea 11061_1 CR5-6]|uniref:Uncharacterized protein n=1 Tax=Phlebiopsis gigantea (strain 11061_1 CR5-6) TaxID=745531 RepID=A0A0C3RZB5_PHLG1|nr:hypothetical protein PHLGIDRAFT_123080 [Phlebiopsis gigantea 11061_1 CR5-6]